MMLNLLKKRGEIELGRVPGGLISICDILFLNKQTKVSEANMAIHVGMLKLCERLLSF